MADDCCKLVGNFVLNVTGCIISVSVNSSTEASKICEDTLVIGPTIGTASVVGYATDTIHTGCPGRAGVSIPWVRKWDCENNEVYFLFAGQGRSFVAGDVQNLATVNERICSYPTMNASAQGGPASIYMETDQEDGYGLRYVGQPFSFETSDENDVTFTNFGVGEGPLYLQSFNLDCSPGNIPTASYSFVFVVENCT